MFKTQNFCHIASNNRNNVKAGVFIYKTNDNLQTVSASGYFNPRIIDINLHDLIIHEYIDPTDNTKVLRNVLCVTVKTLDNIETVVIKSNWEGDIEQEIADLRTYVDNNFVKIDGSSIMSGPLKFIAGSFSGAIAGGLGDGIAFYKINSSGTIQSEVASLTLTNGFVPGSTNTINIGSNALKWKNLYLAGTAYMSKINNGFDIAVPVTNSADTLALKSQVDDAANSGEQLYTTGVWYAKMYSASVVPTGAKYDGKNYADFSQVDNDNNPIVVIYEGQSGSWVEIARITPPANHVAYLTITSKIWDIAEQTDQQGGEVLWSYNQKTFTPYPRIVSVEGLANTDLSNLTATGEARFTLKANTDLSNLTSAGSEVCAHNAMPGTRYDDLTLGASGTEYTAPADGYVYVQKFSDANRYIKINAGNYAVSSFAPNYNSAEVTVLCPVRKNQVYKILYDLNGTTSVFRFIYANGAA